MRSVVATHHIQSRAAGKKEFYRLSFGSARLIGLMFASDCFSRNISLAHLNQSASHSSSMGSLSRTNAVKKPSTYLTDSV